MMPKKNRPMVSGGFAIIIRIFTKLGDIPNEHE